MRTSVPHATCQAYNQTVVSEAILKVILFMTVLSVHIVHIPYFVRVRRAGAAQELVEVNIVHVPHFVRVRGAGAAQELMEFLISSSTCHWSFSCSFGLIRFLLFSGLPGNMS